MLTSKNDNSHCDKANRLESGDAIDENIENAFQCSTRATQRQRNRFQAIAECSRNSNVTGLTLQAHSDTLF